MKYTFLLILMAIVGAVFVLLSTRYGAGLEFDSENYIATARNLIRGIGFIGYNGDPFVLWPPLYPAILATVGMIFRTDPFLIANVVNALIFGLIVYLGGVLTFRHLSSFPVFAFVGALTIVFSIPLFAVSLMAWTEPVFILFVILSLIFAESYLAKNDIASLMLLSSSIALSCLTRYIGVSLILWGALIIIFRRDGPKARIRHLSLFILISALPLGIWLIRNYAITSTLFGPREPSIITLPQSLYFTSKTLLIWYVPRRIAISKLILILLCASSVVFIGLCIKDIFQRVKVIAKRMGPIILFIVVYAAFLIISEVTTLSEWIDNRYLSPIYVPLTLLLLIFIQELGEVYQKTFPKKIVNCFLAIGIMIWLIYPIGVYVVNAIEQTQTGDLRRLSNKAWMESETIRHLRRQPSLQSANMGYTNDPIATFILARLELQQSPFYRNDDSVETAISRLKGIWPQRDKACLVWFNKIPPHYYPRYLTVDELQAAANLDLIVQFDDAAIYSIRKK